MSYCYAKFHQNSQSLLKMMICVINPTIIQNIKIITMILGQMSLARFLWIYIPAIFLAPCYTYYMAVTKGQQKPYPHATITSTACHYPQDIIMRIIMLVGASFLTLVFYTANRWLEFQAIRTGFPLYSRILYYLAQISIFCYLVTIGTIDGKGTGKPHDINAIIFFVIWLVTIMTMTVYVTKLYNWDTSILTYKSLLLKQIIAGYIALVWIYCLTGIFGESEQSNKQDIYVVIVEWNSVFGNLLWILSFVCEWKHFKLGLASKTKNSGTQLNTRQVSQLVDMLESQ